jgi:menaquinone-dependent protoporphyrinogen oxidase
MSKRVLIAYGSRFGSTEEIARKIGEVLAREGIEPEYVDLRKTGEGKWPSPLDFDGILVGSGIRIAKWTKEAESFLEKNKDYFQGKKALGLFVSCGSAVQDKEQARKDYLEKVIDTLGVTAVMYEAFGPLYDLSSSSKMGFLDKRMLKMASEKAWEEAGLQIDKNGRNDLRDWKRIEEFGREFAVHIA